MIGVKTIKLIHLQPHKQKEGITMTLGEKLYRLREKRGLSQEELAQNIGISPQTLATWEQNLSTPDNTSLIKVVDFFGITSDYLSTEDKRILSPSTKGLSKNEWCIAWGVGLLLIAFVLSFFVKIIALSVTRTSFTYEINYLLHFPLNTVVITAIILLAYGIYTLRK